MIDIIGEFTALPSNKNSIGTRQANLSSTARIEKYTATRLLVGIGPKNGIVLSELIVGVEATFYIIFALKQAK